jgi:hypothetical protein
VEIDGNQALGTVSNWTLAPLGTTYQWDYLNSRDVADPVMINLTAGGHVITIFGREDGARLDRLELESVRPLASMTTAMSVVSGVFSANVSFSESVTGLTQEDFTVTGGAVVSVAGTGAAYTVSVVPSSEQVVLKLPANTVTDSEGHGNFSSSPLTLTYRNPYQQWAFDNQVAATQSTMLLDEDGDGTAKLLEFAFNLDPGRADIRCYDPSAQPAAGLPRMILQTLAPGASRLSIQFLRRKSVPGLNYRAQFGPAPDQFTDATTVPLLESINSEWERVTISDPDPGGSPHRLGRVVVEMAGP